MNKLKLTTRLALFSVTAAAVGLLTGCSTPSGDTTGPHPGGANSYVFKTSKTQRDTVVLTIHTEKSGMRVAAGGPVNLHFKAINSGDTISGVSTSSGSPDTVTVTITTQTTGPHPIAITVD